MSLFEDFLRYTFAAMKYAVIVLSAVIALAQQPTKTPESRGAAKGKGARVGNQADDGQGNNQPTPQPLAPDNQKPAPTFQQATSKTNDDAGLQGKLVTFTELLVVVGFLQFFALIGQVVIYRRQAKIMAYQASELTRQRVTMGNQLGAMEGQLSQMKEAGEQTDKMIKQATIAAEAAKQSAQALMDGERAWLLVEEVGIAEDPIAAAIEQAGDGPVQIGGTWLECTGATFAIVNYGKTPGRILAVDARTEIGTSREEPPNAKEVYESGAMKNIMVLMIGTNKTNVIEEHIVPQQGTRIEIARFPPFNHLTAEKLTRIKNDADFLWVYGIVRYKDVYDRQHETKFCYRYIVPPEEPLIHFCLRGPESYNKAT